ncbi:MULTISPECIES: hypothetical protein [unclassified Pseudoalteromonas]|uniref:hypothetical protein n=1 Tax=unclassified Pseudoalteromonas TaxID=194690 RepID=UPI0005A954D8|nr:MULTISPECIES: hypothetical protein [unclassified Pseudoalteromonas]
MNKKKLTKLILKEFPTFSNSGDYIFVNPLEHILSGFLIEKTRRGIYIWRFIYPLFDCNEHLSLLYSDRLDVSKFYINSSELSDKDISDKDISDKVLNIIQQNIYLAHECKTIADFCTELQNKKGILEHKHAQMIYGFALILNNKEELAKEYLLLSVSKLSEPFKSRCMEVLKMLDNDVDSAKQVILELEDRMKQLLKI